MQDNSEVERPPKPVWGDQITVPTEFDEFVNENLYEFRIDESERQRQTSNAISELSPTEEYLQMTMRLIESNSLSPETTAILKDLYSTYKSNHGYGPAIYDTKNSAAKQKDARKDSTKTIKSYQSQERLYKSHTFPAARINAIAQRRISDKSKDGQKQEEPSTSTETKHLQSSSIKPDLIAAEDFDLKMRRDAFEAIDISELLISQTLRDSESERPCDPEMIKVDNIFSDFSLSDVGHDNALKKRIGQWMAREGRASLNAAGSSRRNERESNYGQGAQKENPWKKVYTGDTLIYIRPVDFKFSAITSS